MSTKERQDSNERSDYPKIPSDFQCFVCGGRFATNEERKQHLEKTSHGGLYSSESAYEREDTKRQEILLNQENHLQ
jgi:hypothetical protein